MIKNKIIEVYFDVGSPASYLAWTQLPAFAQRNQAELNWKPMLLGGVFQATGNQSPAMIPAKGRYTQMDFERYADAYQVPLKFNPYFPVNTLLLMRGAVAFLDTAQFQNYLKAVFTALWVDEQDMNQVEVVGAVLAKAGFDPQDVLNQCSTDEVKTKLKKITEEAVARGVFGAPTMFSGDNMFFGQDRLALLEQALQNR